MITIPRFEPKVEQRGVKLTIDGKGIVSIKDHTTDKIIGIVNLDQDGNKNMELAELIISTIENYIESEPEQEEEVVEDEH